MRQLFLLTLAILYAMFFVGCATPHYEDGTRASFVSSFPCNADNCGKPAFAER